MSASADTSAAASSAASATNATTQWKICRANIVNVVYYVPPSLSDAAEQQWLDDTLRDIERAHTVPSYEASATFRQAAEPRFGGRFLALSHTLDWHTDRLRIGERWSVGCTERAAARVCSELRDCAYDMRTSEAAWDDARVLFVRNFVTPTEQQVRAIGDAFTRDVHADEELSAVLRRRCHLGARDASNWLVERDPQWPSE